MIKLIKHILTGMLLVGPTLSLIACQKPKTAPIIEAVEEKDLIIQEKDLNRADLISKSLIASRSRKWAITDILKDVLPTEKLDIKQLFSKGMTPEKVLTQDYQNFKKPVNNWIYKDNYLEMVHGLLRDLFKKDAADNFNFFKGSKKIFDLMQTFLSVILNQPKLKIFKEILNGDYTYFITALNKGLDENQKLINKNYQEIFIELFPVGKEDQLIKLAREIQELYKSGSLQGKEKQIASFIERLPKLVLPVLNFLNDYAKATINVNSEENSNLILMKKYEHQPNLISNLVENITTIFSHQAKAGEENLKQIFFANLMSLQDAPFARWYVPLLVTLGELLPNFTEEKFNEFLSENTSPEIIQLLEAIAKLLPWEAFDKILNNIVNASKKDNVAYNIELLFKKGLSPDQLIKAILLELGFNPNDSDFKSDSLLKNLFEAIKHPTIFNFLQDKVLENNNLWKKQDDYVTKIIKSNMIANIEQQIKKDLRNRQAIVNKEYTFSGQKFIFIWEFNYDKNDHLTMMKIVGFKD